MQLLLFFLGKNDLKGIGLSSVFAIPSAVVAAIPSDAASTSTAVSASAADTTLFVLGIYFRSAFATQRLLFTLVARNLCKVL